MIADQDYADALDALMWQIELGATEAIGNQPVSRYQEPSVQAPVGQKTADKPVAVTMVAPSNPSQIADQAVAVAENAAARADDLASLRAAIAAYEYCVMKKGARSLVFADGNPAARVMIVGEAPGSNEDREGKPFVGAAGQLLDKMFAAIGLSRAAPEAQDALYITNVLPWRPPQNRDPSTDEIAMMLPFLKRHIALAKPEILVVMGNAAAKALLGRGAITRIRGTWTEVDGLPALAMTHPAYLLRTPSAKREAWADLLALKARLKG